LLGDLFIKNQYVVYDYGKRQIGFAQKVENVSGGIGLNSQNAAGPDLKQSLKSGSQQAAKAVAATAAVLLASSMLTV